MSVGSVMKNFFDNFESYVCRFLLSFFITLLFAQILSREFFQHTIPWGMNWQRICLFGLPTLGPATPRAKPPITG